MNRGKKIERRRETRKRAFAPICLSKIRGRGVVSRSELESFIHVDAMTNDKQVPPCAYFV